MLRNCKENWQFLVEIKEPSLKFFCWDLNMTEKINKRIPECGRYKLFQIPELHDGVRQSEVAAYNTQ